MCGLVSVQIQIIKRIKLHVTKCAIEVYEAICQTTITDIYSAAVSSAVCSPYTQSNKKLCIPSATEWLSFQVYLVGRNIDCTTKIRPYRWHTGKSSWFLFIVEQLRQLLCDKEMPQN